MQLTLLIVLKNDTSFNCVIMAVIDVKKGIIDVCPFENNEM